MKPGRSNSIHLAYEIAVKSYDVLFGRITASNDKIQSLLSVSCTVTFAAIITGKALDLNMKSGWLAAILTIFVITIAVSFYALFQVKKGDLVTLDPKVVFKEYSHLPASEFRSQITKHAGNDFDHNAALLLAKWKLANCITRLILLEVALFVLWVSFFG